MSWLLLSKTTSSCRVEWWWQNYFCSSNNSNWSRYVRIMRKHSHINLAISRICCILSSNTITTDWIVRLIHHRLILWRYVNRGVSRNLINCFNFLLKLLLNLRIKVSLLRKFLRLQGKLRNFWRVLLRRLSNQSWRSHPERRRKKEWSIIWWNLTTRTKNCSRLLDKLRMRSIKFKWNWKVNQRSYQKKTVK